MILIDHHIEQLCLGVIPPAIREFYEYLPSKVQPLVDPYDPDLINPHSLDVRIGYSAKLRKDGGYSEINLGFFNDENPYWIAPGDRLLVASLETFNIPEFTAATFYMKSSRGREWYGHQLAGYIDAGWHGSKLTMEITNDDIDLLPLYPGMRFGQLEFKLLLELPMLSYAQTGRYNNDLLAQESKG